MFNSNNNNNTNFSTSLDNPFRSDGENPSNEISKFIDYYSYSFHLDDLLNDNTNMSTISLSSTIYNLILISLE